MQRRADVLIIGAGVVGICTAYYLHQKGHNVALVDKAQVGMGSSYGNAGMIVPSHSVPMAEPGVVSQGLRYLFRRDSPFYIKPRLDRNLLRWLWHFRRACTRGHVKRSMPLLRDLNLESLHLYTELAARPDLDFGFERRGRLLLCTTQKGLERLQAEAELLGSIGLKTECLDPAGIQNLEPAIRFAAAGGVFYPQDAHLDPARFVGALARYLRSQHIEIHSDTEVLGFTTSGNKITAVKTTRGDCAARQVVLAGGSWSPEVARDLQLKLPIQPAKGYSVTVDRPAGQDLGTPLMLTEAKVAVTPMGRHLRFAGTLELAGFDLAVNQRRVNALLQSVPAYLPELNPTRCGLVEVWRGLRPCSPDGLPFIGRSQAYPNLVVAAGHSTIGMSLGPVSGILVAQIIAGETPEFDLKPLEVERFV